MVIMLHSKHELEEEQAVENDAEDNCMQCGRIVHKSFIELGNTFCNKKCKKLFDDELHEDSDWIEDMKDDY